ncbi:MAG: hypothetical protein Q9201_001976 [Fulgogasparrea decipioides]
MRHFVLLALFQASLPFRAEPALLHGQAPLADDVLAAGPQTLRTPSFAAENTSSVQTSLQTDGRTIAQPFPTEPIPSVTSTLAPKNARPVVFVAQPTPTAIPTDIFAEPVSTGAPAPNIVSRNDHPVPRKGILDRKLPKSTNKFYANLFLGNQTNSVWTQPYTLQWSQGAGNAMSWGMSVSHIEEDQRVFGPNTTANPVEYYANPVGIQSMIFSAAELGPGMTLTTDSLTAFSVNANLIAKDAKTPAITLPLVEGMGFVTAIYHSVTPFIDSSVFFHTITPVRSPKVGVTKYKILLDDGNTWLLYATAANSSGLALTATSNTRLQAAGPFEGTIQVAKNPGNVVSHEQSYDTAAGAFATSASLSGSVDGNSGSYTFSWAKAGNKSPLMMFALPHHIQSMAASTSTGKTAIQLQTTVKGLATGVIGDTWAMTEPELPTSIGFTPWNTASGSHQAIVAAAQQNVKTAGGSELSQDMNKQSNLNSMYYSGKALSKFATAIYALHDLAGDVDLARAGLDKLKEAFARFTGNTQQFPLVYESAWGGIVSTASYVTGDPGVDFGNSYYNDHHFHWSYFVHAAAIIGYLDPLWIAGNKGNHNLPSPVSLTRWNLCTVYTSSGTHCSPSTDWVNTLIRDAANPSSSDPYFPVSRSFDWYNGHSWAKGLFDSSDGKDQESSSEDAFFSYSMKMWGRITGDAAMEARGNLMLAVQKRTFQNYFLMEKGNVNQPAKFVRNKVAGITFENKCDHVTYFGSKPEFVQGIHMIPINPSSGYTRNQNFVNEEWETYFDKGRVDEVEGGWRGILYSNLALIDPKAAYDWFSGPNFDPQYLDNGASLTWYLALSAGIGGATA